MKTITRKLLSAAFTCAALNRALGPKCQWIDKLSDMRLHRGSVRGIVLLPAAATPAKREECRRPLYTVEAVHEFIIAVREAFGVEHPFAEPVDSFTVQTADGTLSPSNPFWRSCIARPATGTPATA